MTVPTWPAALPQDLLLGGGEEAPTMVLRTQMEAGPAKVRRRWTAAPRPVTGSLSLTQAQARTLDAFYTVTLAGGSLRFRWKRPLTGMPAEMRFTAPPAFTCADLDDWRVSLSLEVLP